MPHAICWCEVPLELRVAVRVPFQGIEQGRRFLREDGAPLEQIISEERAAELRATFPGCTRRAGRYVGVVLETGFSMVHESQIVGEGVASEMVVDALPERRKMLAPDGTVLVRPKKARAERAEAVPERHAEQDAPSDDPGTANERGASSRVEEVKEAVKRIAKAVLPKARDPRLPPPGTPIRREFKGSVFVAIESEAGFALSIEGDSEPAVVYSSLSRAASAVAGSSQNGFLWFGLIKRG
jgi:hypothetical protein